MYYTGLKQISSNIEKHFGDYKDLEIELSQLVDTAFEDVEDYSKWPVETEQDAYNLLYDAILDAFAGQSYSDNEVGIIAAEVYLRHHGYRIDANKHIVYPNVEETLEFLISYEYTLDLEYRNL